MIRKGKKCEGRKRERKKKSKKRLLDTLNKFSGFIPKSNVAYLFSKDAFHISLDGLSKQTSLCAKDK
jgi:hypothetical protein